MSKSDSFENSFLQLIFNNQNIANIGDATGVRASTTAGQLFVSLHTSDPGEAGNQGTNEITTGAYQNYVRVGVNRATGAGGFTVTGNSVSPASNIDFATAGAGSTGAVVTHFGIGTSSSGAGVLLYKGTVSPNISISNGVSARLTTASAITED